MTLGHEMRNRFFDELCSDKDLMWMGQNTNHFDPHPDVLAAIKASLDSGEYHIYAPPLGLEELRHLIIEDMGLPTASAMVTNGAVEGLYNVCSLFNVAGKDFITTDPSWAWPMNFAKKSGANVIQVPIYGAAGGYKLDIEYLKAAVSDKTQMIYVVDPNNPLGTCHTEAEIREIAELAKSVGAYLVHDSTYCHFATDYVPAYDFYPEKTIITYSFSKWLGLAGMRLGAVIASPQNIELLASSPPNNLGCNIVAQRAAIAGLRTKDAWFPTVMQRLTRNQKCVYEAVKKIPGLHIPVYPSQANFLVIETEAAGITPEALVSAYKDANIMIRQGQYHTKEFGHKFVKVSLTVPEAWVDKFCEYLPSMVERARSAEAETAALF
jgi:histidinol-phosphate/aromatic aminotransferase/cobyric acid decarboxylase-like protein